VLNRDFGYFVALSHQVLAILPFNAYLIRVSASAMPKPLMP